MTIPISSTRITILRSAESGTRDPYETAPSWSTVASGVRAVIGGPSFREQFIGGAQQVITNHLTCDVCDLTANDQVTDETTGLTFEVVGVAERAAFGLDHMTASLRLVTGEAAA